MANHQHFEYLQQGVATWNQWRNENPGEVPDLEGVNLEGAILEEVHFEGANLTGANLKGANLWRAYLKKANLAHADLRMADLQMSDLRGANLTHADLEGAVLMDSDLQEASLSDANLHVANITGARLYKMICERWIIDGIVCAYLFLGPGGSQRIPVGRNFRPTEFEKCFKHPQLADSLPCKMLRQILHLFSFHSVQRNGSPFITENDFIGSKW